MVKKIYKDTVVAMTLSLNKFGSFSMAQYDFTIYAYCDKDNVVEIPKREAVRINDDAYMFWVDTAKTGCGKLRFAVKAMIPDTDLPTLMRPELVDEIDSGYYVTQSVASDKVWGA